MFLRLAPSTSSKWSDKQAQHSKSAIAGHSLNTLHIIKIQETRIINSTRGFWDNIILVALQIQEKNPEIIRDIGYQLSWAWNPLTGYTLQSQHKCGAWWALTLPPPNWPGTGIYSLQCDSPQCQRLNKKTATDPDLSLHLDVDGAIWWTIVLNQHYPVGNVRIITAVFTGKTFRK